jgi:hypothetical protein
MNAFIFHYHLADEVQNDALSGRAIRIGIGKNITKCWQAGFLFLYLIQTCKIH